MCYRKVAAVSGDARRALDICRRATEIAEFSESTNSKMVSMVHVNQALAEMITSAKVTAIQNCSVMEKIFLQAVAAEVHFQVSLAFLFLQTFIICIY